MYRVPDHAACSCWSGRILSLLLALGYAVLLIAYWKSAPDGNFGGLDGVAQLFSSRGKLAGGWPHFLAFDLFVGRWVVDDVLQERRSRWLLLPSLPLVFLYGPAGLLTYFALRTFTGSNVERSSN